MENSVKLTCPFDSSKKANYSQSYLHNPENSGLDNSFGYYLIMAAFFTGPLLMLTPNAISAAKNSQEGTSYVFQAVTSIAGAGLASIIYHNLFQIKADQLQDNLIASGLKLEACLSGDSNESTEEYQT
jgi:hypothetical protein